MDVQLVSSRCLMLATAIVVCCSSINTQSVQLQDQRKPEISPETFSKLLQVVADKEYLLGSPEPLSRTRKSSGVLNEPWLRDEQWAGRKPIDHQPKSGQDEVSEVRFHAVKHQANVIPSEKLQHLHNLVRFLDKDESANPVTTVGSGRHPRARNSETVSEQNEFTFRKSVSTTTGVDKHLTNSDTPAETTTTTASATTQRRQVGGQLETFAAVSSVATSESNGWNFDDLLDIIVGPATYVNPTDSNASAPYQLTTVEVPDIVTNSPNITDSVAVTEVYSRNNNRTQPITTTEALEQQDKVSKILSSSTKSRETPQTMRTSPDIDQIVTNATSAPTTRVSTTSSPAYSSIEPDRTTIGEPLFVSTPTSRWTTAHIHSQRETTEDSQDYNDAIVKYLNISHITVAVVCLILIVLGSFVVYALYKRHQQRSEVLLVRKKDNLDLFRACETNM